MMFKKFNFKIEIGIEGQKYTHKLEIKEVWKQIKGLSVY